MTPSDRALLSKLNALDENECKDCSEHEVYGALYDTIALANRLAGELERQSAILRVGQAVMNLVKDGKGFRLVASSDTRSFRNAVVGGLTLQMYRDDWSFGFEDELHEAILAAITPPTPEESA